MNSSAIDQLFVYGSLRSGFKSPAYEYIGRFFSFVSEAKVKGKLFDLGSYPGGVPAEDKFIIGELYKIKDRSEFSWAIGQLDDYEGINPGDNSNSLYRRQLVEVFIDNGLVPAWVYWYNGPVDDSPLIASGDILDYIKRRL